MPEKKYQCPNALLNSVSQRKYERWLQARASAHVRRDRRRGHKDATVSMYKMAIHDAVLECGGCDTYTGEVLNWALIGTYDNRKSKAGKRHYKKKFAKMPSVDHVGDGTSGADFRICAWSVNDAKNDLPHNEFVELCRRVVAWAERDGCAEYRLW